MARASRFCLAMSICLENPLTGAVQNILCVWVHVVRSGLAVELTCLHILWGIVGQTAKTRHGGVNVAPLLTLHVPDVLHCIKLVLG